MENADKLELHPHHCGISVADIEASIDWYCRMLGFTLEKRVKVEGVPAKIAFIKNGDFMIELFEIPDAAPLPEDRKHPNRDILTHGTKHMAYQVNDTKQLVEDLKSRGVEVALDVQIIDNTIMAFIRDNTGNLIELIQPLD